MNKYAPFVNFWGFRIQYHVNTIPIKNYNETINYFYEILIKKRNIENVNDCLSVIKLLHHLLDNHPQRLYDYSINRVGFNWENYSSSALNMCIQNHMKKKNCSPYTTDDLAEFYLVLKLAIEKHHIEFEQLSILFSILSEDSCSFSSYCQQIRNTPIIVFMVFHSYLSSPKFKKLFDYAVREKKRVVLIKMEEDIQFNFEPNENIEIYDLSIHMNHEYEGYETRRLLNGLNLRHEVIFILKKSFDLKINFKIFK